MADEPKQTAPESGTFRSVYNDTTYFIDSIMKEYDVFSSILEMMRDGNASIELKKRYLLRAIDETWVNAIEDTLPALDIIIRNPSKYIEEREEVLPIELSRNISVRSLQHLSQHTNYISKIEGDNITPTKILNVFREETLQTYENKFINTLINRLYAFVNRRYEIARKAGQDEKTTSVEFKEEFRHDDVNVKMNLRIEIAENAESENDRVERNYTHTTDLWQRVKRLNSIVSAYTNSEFVQNMGHSFIHPPVMRTNAILKNKNLRQCLTLWQFIEGYESAGYSMLIQEDLENVDDAYVKELYSTLALQYLIFRYNIHNEFEVDHTLASQITEGVLSPRIVDELSKVSEQEFDIREERTAPAPAKVRYNTLTPEDQLLFTSLDVALDAAEIIRTQRRADLYEPAPIPEPKPEAVPVSEPEEEQEEPAQAIPAAEEPKENAPTEESLTEDAPEEESLQENTPEEEVPAAPEVKAEDPEPTQTEPSEPAATEAEQKPESEQETEPVQEPEPEEIPDLPLPTRTYPRWNHGRHRRPMKQKRDI